MSKIGTLLLLACCIACQPAEQPLLGHWQGTALTENGDSVAVDTDLIQLDIQADRRYRFASTLLYVEAGTYRLDGDYLYTTDTTQRNPGEKAVRIEYLQNDSLILDMQRGESHQRLWLVRE